MLKRDQAALSRLHAASETSQRCSPVPGVLPTAVVPRPEPAGQGTLGRRAQNDRRAAGLGSVSPRHCPALTPSKCRTHLKCNFSPPRHRLSIFTISVIAFLGGGSNQ